MSVRGVARWLAGSRWCRAALFGVAMAAAAGGLMLVFPLKGSGVSSRLRTLYLPGFAAVRLLGGRPGVGADVERVLLVARLGTVLLYSVVGVVVGAAFRRWQWAAVVCVLSLAAVVGIAARVDRREAQRRTDYEQGLRRRYLAQAQARLETHPEDVEARSLIAHYSLYYFDAPDVAEREYRRIIEIEGNQPTLHSLHAHLELAIVCQEQGRRDEAAEEFRRYRELIGQLAVPDGDRAILLLREKDYGR